MKALPTTGVGGPEPLNRDGKALYSIAAAARADGKVGQSHIVEWSS